MFWRPLLTVLTKGVCSTALTQPSILFNTGWFWAGQPACWQRGKPAYAVLSGPEQSSGLCSYRDSVCPYCDISGCSWLLLLLLLQWLLLQCLLGLFEGLRVCLAVLCSVLCVAASALLQSQGQCCSTIRLVSLIVLVDVRIALVEVRIESILVGSFECDICFCL